uniref:ANK_REP_REGION domain-containing protein n=1 Tax=Macrostomum lignano TaxID=282301 RepID=A0A1I8F9C6_9PLAT
HDIPERVELSVFADSQRPAQPGLHFTPDPLLGVAADIADKFPLVPESLSSLASGGQAAADTDRRLAAAWQTRAAETGEPDGGEPPPRRTAFHCLAEAGWLESLAQLLRLTGQPEFWLLGQPEPEGGRTAVQLLRERRFRSLLASPGRLRAWLEQLDGRASRLQGQEDSVVKVRSWRTPSGADLVFMTTNKEKGRHPAGAGPQHLPTPGGRHVEDSYMLPPPQMRDPVPDSHTTRGRRRCAPDGGRPLHRGPPGQPDSLRGSSGLSLRLRPLREDDSLPVHDLSGESLDELLNEPLDESSMMQSVLFDSPSMRCGHFQQQQQQQQQLEHASWSISTSSLIEDAARQQTMRRFQHPSQTRRRKLEVGRPHPMESLADDAGSSLPWAAGRATTGSKGGGSGGGGKIKGGGSRLATYEHSWRIATAGVCAVCEARQSRSAHLTVANAECLSSQTALLGAAMASQAAAALLPRCHCLRDLSRLPPRSPFPRPVLSDGWQRVQRGALRETGKAPAEAAAAELCRGISP